MKNNRKRILALKYILFILLFLLLYVLQTTPRFLSVFGVRPFWLIPAGVALAMYEGEFAGGLFGALAGMLCDLSAPSLYGLYSVLLLIFGTACGLLVLYLMHRSLLVAFLLTFCVTALCTLARFYFDYGLWGYAGIGSLFLRQTLPTVAYTTLVTPLFFWLFGRLEAYFAGKINV